MRKIKSVLYDIYPHTAFLFSFKEEYEALLEPIVSYAKAANQSLSILFDAGQYEFEEFDTLSIKALPNIHIVIACPDTSSVEEIIEQAISQSAIYKDFEKFSVDENALTPSNIKFLDRYFIRQDRIKVHHTSKKNVVSITRQDIYDL